MHSACRDLLLHRTVRVLYGTYTKRFLDFRAMSNNNAAQREEECTNDIEGGGVKLRPVDDDASVTLLLCIQLSHASLLPSRYKVIDFFR